MNPKFTSRTCMLLGNKLQSRLENSKVAVFGLGGVGSFTVEALARSGIEKLIIIDNDVVSESNINRQLIANVETINQDKVSLVKQRVKLINPNISVVDKKMFLLPGDDISFIFDCDYVIDAIDTVSSKIYLAEVCNKNKINLISSMGTGNKLDPAKLEIEDIFKTTVCPLCRVMRKELKARNVKNLKVIYSKETPVKPLPSTDCGDNDRTPGSMIFVPAIAGIMLAREVVFDILKGVQNDNK